MIVYLVLILAAMLLADWKLGIICYAAAWIVYGLYYRNAMKYFGGTTGDLAGCFLTLCELFTACAVVVAGLVPGI